MPVNRLTPTIGGSLSQLHPTQSLDLALAQADAQSIRLYAMSAAILASRSDYYRILEKSQSSHTNITEWLEWFLLTLNTTLQMALAAIDRRLQKNFFGSIFTQKTFLPNNVKFSIDYWMVVSSDLKAVLVRRNIKKWLK